MITNGKIVAVNFVPGSGGKFIQNCLALSRHCVIKDPGYARWQIDRPFNGLLYDQKLAWLLKTIPPQELMHNWLQYELRDDHFFGRIFSDTDSGEPLPQLFDDIALKSQWVTYSAHSHGSAKHVERHWPEVRYLCVVNADRFIADWAEIKNHNTTNLGTNWQTPEYLGFKFDMDSCIYNESAFLEQMRNVYKWLRWSDFDLAPIAEYYRAYIAIHKK